MKNVGSRDHPNELLFEKFVGPLTGNIKSNIILLSLDVVNEKIK